MRRIALTLLLPAALILAGCLLIESITVEQDGPGAPVRIVVKLCPIDEAPNPDVCHATNNFPASTTTQMLVAFQVPDGFVADEVKLTGSNTDTLASFDSFAAAMQTADPAPAGRKWVGFRTGTLPAVAPEPKRGTFTAVFDTPGAGGGAPAADMPHKTAVGSRANGAACPVDAPISTPGCGAAPGYTLISPLTGTSLSGTQAIRDLALRADGDRPVVERGARGSVPFTVRYAGATPSGDVPVGGSTTIPGATVVPGMYSRSSTGDGPLGLGVDVPATTPPGVYDVTMLLDLVGDEARELTRQVEVRVPPTPSLTGGPLAFAATTVGQTTAPLPLALSNVGQRGLDVRAAELSGANAGDFVLEDGCGGRSVVPGANCPVGVRFRPTGPGARSATVKVPTAGGDVTAQLSGRGVAAAVAQSTRPVTLATIRAALRRVRFLSTRKSSVRRSGLRFVQEFVVAGDATWSLTRGGSTASAAQAARLGRLTTRISRAGRRTVTLRLTRRGRAALRGRRALRVSLTTVFTDAQRRRVSVSIPVRLR